MEIEGEGGREGGRGREREREGGGMEREGGGMEGGRERVREIHVERVNSFYFPML